MQNYYKTTVVALDDGYFPHPKKKGYTTLAGVLCLGRTPIDARIELIEVDGLDATSKALNIIEFFQNKYGRIEVVLLDGVTYAGFNILDARVIKEVKSIDYIIVFKKKLNLDKVRDALQKHFKDWRIRWNVIDELASRARKLTTSKGVIYYTSSLSRIEVLHIVEELQTYYPIPEPLRIADEIASKSSRYLRIKGVLKPK